MKQLSFLLVMLLVIVSSCQKNSSDLTQSATPSTPVVQKAPAPTASFKIDNALSPTSLWEGLALTIENTSSNAVSYFWDFGNGITSTDKAPSNIEIFPCGVTNTITLTVKNKDGQVATYSVPYYIQCSRGMPFGSHKG